MLMINRKPSDPFFLFNSESTRRDIELKKVKAIEKFDSHTCDYLPLGVVSRCARDTSISFLTLRILLVERILKSRQIYNMNIRVEIVSWCSDMIIGYGLYQKSFRRPTSARGDSPRCFCNEEREQNDRLMTRQNFFFLFLKKKHHFSVRIGL